MLLHCTTAWVLASDEFARRLQPMRQGFRAEAGESNALAILLSLLGLCVLVVVIDQVYRALAGKRPAARVDYLVQAARLLSLTTGELRDLRTLAGRAGLAHATALLLSPANLAWGLHASGLGGDARLRARLDQLCRRIFGVPLPEPQPVTNP
ncbi:MAG: hypothetical protein AB1716_18675 [Planctomycetota bacterium]